MAAVTVNDDVLAKNLAKNVQRTTEATSIKIIKDG